MRAVLDVNVLVAALLSPGGTPARIFRLWLDGAFELVVSPLLIDELTRTLSYPKLRDRITADEAETMFSLLLEGAEVRPDPDGPPPAHAADPADDYLIALAEDSRSLLVSGDQHLLDLADDLPIHRPREFLTMLQAEAG